MPFPRGPIAIVLATACWLSLLSGAGVAAPKRPDLVVRGVKAAPLELVPGGSMKVTAKTFNRGKARAARSLTSFFVSSDKRKSKDDLLLGKSHSVPALRPGRSSKKTLSIVLPDALATGDYYLIACADAKNKVREANEKNNCTVAKHAVSIREPQSSLELIDEAIASGRITEDQGLVYKIFVEFGDDRLPAEFRGNDEEHRHSHALREAAERFEAMSPEHQAILEPFFVPPAYEGSWFDRHEQAPMRLTSSDPVPHPLPKSGWDSLGAPGVKVWWQKAAPENQATAQLIADEVSQKILPKLTALMGPPKPDGALTYNGGDDRLDIYLIQLPKELAGKDKDGVAVAEPATYRCDDTPAFIVMEPAAFGGAAERLKATSAHEVMHAIQLGYKVGSCNRYAWWMEATAEWAIDFVYGKETQREHESAPHFHTQPHVSLPDNDPYGAYLFPFYLALWADPGMVKTSFDLAGGKSQPLDAIEEAIGGFDAKWHEFALLNWNHGPVNDFEQADDLRSGAITVDTKVQKGVVQIDPRPIGKNEEVFLNTSVQPLAAHYHWYEFKDGVGKVLFTNPVHQGVPDMKIQALVKIGADWKSPADWSEVAEKEFCRNDSAQNITELVLIVSNSGKSDPLPSMERPSIRGLTCPDVSGTITYTRNETIVVEDGCCSGSTSLEAMITVRLASDGGFLVNDGSSYQIDYNSQVSGRGWYGIAYCDQSHTVEGTGSGPVSLHPGKIVEEGEHSPITGGPAETRELLMGIGTMTYEKRGYGSFSNCANESHNWVYDDPPYEDDIRGNSDFAEACGETFKSWFEFVAPAKGSNTLMLSCSHTDDWGGGNTVVHTLTGTLTIGS